MARPVVLAARLGFPALLAAGCSSRIGMPEPGTQQGDEVIALWQVLFWTAVALATLVLGLLAWCLIRYRVRNGDEAVADGALPPQIRGNVKVEALYVAVPTLIVAAIFVLSVRTEPATATAGRGGGPSLPVDVTGFQWQWRFAYPEEGVTVIGAPDAPPELVLPTGRPVRLRLRSPDVIHSFYVPGFLGKIDVIPGRDQTMDLRPVRPGRYQGFCAEFCGLNHARMNFTVRVVDPAGFDDWVRSAAGRP